MVFLIIILQSSLPVHSDIFLICFLYYHLDTFGVESVVITDTTGGRVCLECSFSSFSTDTGCTVELISSCNGMQYTETIKRSDNSTAKGCTVELVSSGNSSSVKYTETINRSGNGTAKGCVYGIARGRYDISVYDQSSHMLFETFTGVNVTRKTTTTTTTPGRTTTSTITSTHESTSIIAGKYDVHNLYLFCFNLENYTCSINKILILTVIITVYMIVYTDYMYLH